MIRNLITMSLGLVIVTALAATARAANPEDAASKKDGQDLRDDLQKLTDSIKRLGDQHNNLLKTLDKRDELVDSDIKKANDRINDLERKTTDAITDLNKKIDDLQKKIDRMSGAPGGRVA